jgi:hypothetical protein
MSLGRYLGNGIGIMWLAMATPNYDLRAQKQMGINVGEINIDGNLEKIKKTETQSASQLTRREKFRLQQQLYTCYQLAKNDKSPLEIDELAEIFMQISLNRSGTIDFNQLRINITDLKGNTILLNTGPIVTFLKKVLDYCNPLHNLPSQKYELWKNINIVFYLRIP